MKRVSKTRYIGKICVKHPELGGERLRSTYGCVRCHRERWLALSAKRKGTKVGLAYTNRKRLHQIKRREDEKAAVFNKYGAICVLCGFNDRRALTIDHVKQDGAKHRMPNGKRYTGPWLYRWLIKHKFPKGFRTLCCNCQTIIYQENK